MSNSTSELDLKNVAGADPVDVLGHLAAQCDLAAADTTITEKEKLAYKNRAVMYRLAQAMAFDSMSLAIARAVIKKMEGKA